MTLRTSEITTQEELDQMYSDLVKLYASVESDPDSAVVCPLLNPLPHPDMRMFKVHLSTDMTRILTTRDDGVLTTVLLVNVFEDGVDRIRTCWAANDADKMVDAQLAEGGYAEFFESERSVWMLDTGTEGWVTRDYFENYADVAGSPFDTSIHQPGLPSGETYAIWDDQEWTLTISRPTTDDPWEWQAALK